MPYPTGDRPVAPPYPEAVCRRTAGDRRTPGVDPGTTPEGWYSTWPPSRADASGYSSAMDTTKTQNRTNAPKWRPITLMASVRYRAITFETTNFSANLGIFQPGEQLTPHVARFDDGGRHCIVAGLGGICASVIWRR